MENIKKRPTAVTVIGILFLIASIMMVVSGTFGFIISRFIMPQFIKMSSEIPIGNFSSMINIFKYFDILAIIQIIVALFIIYTSIMFLKLKPWTRIVLEIYSWLSLFLMLGFTIYWISGWTSTTSSIPSLAESPIDSAHFTMFGIIMGIMATMFWAIPVIIIIYFLRKKDIKDLFSKTANTPLPGGC